MLGGGVFLAFAFTEGDWMSSSSLRKIGTGVRARLRRWRLRLSDDVAVRTGVMLRSAVAGSRYGVDAIVPELHAGASDCGLLGWILSLSRC